MTAKEFNERYPVGTHVLYWYMAKEGQGVASKTRTPAWELYTGHPVVSVEGKAGGIHLTHIEVLEKI